MFYAPKVMSYRLLVTQETLNEWEENFVAYFGMTREELGRRLSEEVERMKAEVAAYPNTHSGHEEER